MTWSAALDTLNAAALATFGQTVTVRVGAVETAVPGIVSRPSQSSAIAGLEIHEVAPSVQCRTTAFAPPGATVGNEIVAGGVTYVITTPPEADDGGMTTCLLRVK